MRLGKITVFSLTALLLLSACSGDDAGNNTSQSEKTDTDGSNTTEPPLVIDGHVLPPDPGETGKKTLLGIDSNDNGVRDDVERAIYLTYKRSIERAVLIQNSKLFEEIMKDPIKAAKSKELDEAEFKAMACEGYLRFNYNIDPDNGYEKSEVEFLEDAYINTKERVRAYINFNQESSGGVYSVPGLEDNSADACDFNITELLEAEK